MQLQLPRCRFIFPTPTTLAHIFYIFESHSLPIPFL